MKSVIFGGMLALCGAGAALAQAGPTQDDLDAAAGNSRDWLYATHDYNGWRHVPTDRINAANAADLRPLCLYQVGVTETFQSNGIVHDGVLFTTTPTVTAAIDAATCAEKWRHVWESQRQGIPSQRGLAIKEGVLVRGTTDGHLVALRADTGEEVWRAAVVDPESNDSVNMAPLIYGDMVIAGPAGTVNGWVGAFDLATGEPVWRFNTMPQPGEPGRETWGDEATLARGDIGGGSVWTVMSFDREAERLYVPVGNANPAFYGGDRPGDNLYTNSLLVIDVNTGERLWHYQMAPHDVHNWDTSQAGPLFSAGGRDLVAATGKSGVLQIVDRNTEEVVHKIPVTTMKDAGAPLTREGTHMCPGYLGGVQWNGPSYSPETGLLYVPSIDWCSKFFENPEAPRGGGFEMDPFDMANGWITAVDPVAGEVRWQYEAGGPVIAAVTSTAGGIVLGGNVRGEFVVLDAGSGERLYAFNTGGGLAGGIITYEVGERQYIAVMSGSNSSLWNSTGSPTVIVFGLP